MKALFNNLSWAATVTAGSADANYPATNLNHAFLKKIFKSTLASDTITIAFVADHAIDCFYCAYTNAATITVRLYNSSSVLLATININPTELGDSFTSIAGVRSVEIDIASGNANPVYMGSLGIGAAYSFPGFDDNYEPGYIDNSTVKESSDGQYLINKKERLRSFNLSFITTLAIYTAIFDLVAGMTRPIFIDLFEESRDVVPIVYGIFDGGIQSPSNQSTAYSFSLIAREVR